MPSNLTPRVHSKTESQSQAIPQRKKLITDSGWETIHDAESRDLLRFDPPDRAYVSLTLWIGMDAKEKEILSVMLAGALAEKGGRDNATSITLVEKQSGHILATWGPFGGFKAQ